MRDFKQLLEAQWAQNKFVCVGLDSEASKIPESVKGKDTATRVFSFNKSIVDATKDIVLAYKANSAFYEALRERGMRTLYETVAYINTVAPQVPVILDAKRGDIGNTNNGYVSMAFDYLEVDAITVQPYLGREALQPFLDRKEKGIIVLVKTSNPGAGELQDLKLDGRPLYEHVAERVAKEWDANGNCAVVVGATYPEELKRVREIVGDMPILIPGIGVQGGDVQATVEAGIDSRGWGIVINSSRGILYASNGADFAEAARRKTIELNDMINKYRK